MIKPELESETSHEKRHTRRDLLIKGAIGVAGLVVAREVGVLRVPGLDKLGEVSPTDKIYTSGDTITTPVVDARISGWKVLVDQKEAQESPVEFQLRLVGPDETEVGELGPTGGASIGGDRGKGKDSWILFMEPSVQNREALHVLEYTEESWDAKYPPKKGFSYMIRPKFYTKKDNQADEYESPLVLSENKLPDDAYETVNRLSRLFESWTFPSPVYIRTTTKGLENLRGGYNNQTTGRIYLPEHVLTKPIYEGEAEQKLFHEFCHDITGRIKVDIEDPRAIQRLTSAYENWVKASGFGFPVIGSIDRLVGPIGGQEEIALFQLFDESAYISKSAGRKEVGSHGHPYQTYDEMFASGLTVMRYYPDQMIKAYQTLDAKEQETADGVITAIFAILRRVRPDLKGVDKLLPSYGRFKQLVG